MPIRQIVYVRDDYYYDIHVPGDENYLADGIWSHNSGKTFTAWALATQVVIDQVIQASQGVIAEVPTSGVIPVSDLLDELRSEGRLPGTWQWLRKTPVLGLDDLGAARPTAWALEKMWSLVNARTANGLKTIITTNSDWTALVATWGEPMMDRLRDRSVTIELLGASRRALIPA